MKSKVKKRCKQMLDRLVGIIYAVRITATKYGEASVQQRRQNKGIFLWKIRKCRCRFKDENGNMVENQCWQ